MLFRSDVDISLVVLYDSAEGIESRLQIDQRNIQYTKDDISSLLRYFSEFFARSQIENKYYQVWQNRGETISDILSR